MGSIMPRFGAFGCVNVGCLLSYVTFGTSNVPDSLNQFLKVAIAILLEAFIVQSKAPNDIFLESFGCPLTETSVNF